jgi:mannosyl-3-phosphoglycerate phosphatase
MLVIFTDLDGTLLDSRNYSYEAALPALEFIRKNDIPLIFCSSKTRAEVEYWRACLGNSHPFIVENGGGLYIPRDYFGLRIHAPADRDHYAAFEFGTPYVELVETLRAVSSDTGCEVLGFHQMSALDLSVRYGMTLQQAKLAKQREFDEPFEILGSRTEALLEAIERQGKRWVSGGSLFHLMGVNDKAHCVRLLASHYERVFSRVSTIGLGDGPNDIRFLKAVDIPILLRSPIAGRLQTLLPRARLSTAEGPLGWNDALLGLLRSSGMETVCISAQI